MLAKLILWVRLLSLNQDIHKGRYNIGNVGKTASMSTLTLFMNQDIHKGRYNIGNVGKTASMSMLTLFESRYTLKGRYSIDNVGKTASMSVLTLFESRYTINNQPMTVTAQCWVQVMRNVWKSIHNLFTNMYICWCVFSEMNGLQTE